MKDEFLDLIKTRRSCRKYLTEQIKNEELAAVLEAGTYAPTGKNTQDPWIIAVQNPVLRERIVKLNAEIMGTTSDPYYGAPTIVLVVASVDNTNAERDASCVLENMMLAAHAVGLGSCWINRVDKMFATDEGEVLRKDLGLPEGIVGVGSISLGYPAAPMRQAYPRKEGYYRIIK